MSLNEILTNHKQFFIILLALQESPILNRVASGLLKKACHFPFIFSTIASDT